MEADDVITTLWRQLKAPASNVLLFPLKLLAHVLFMIQTDTQNKSVVSAILSFLDKLLVHMTATSGRDTVSNASAIAFTLIVSFLISFFHRKKALAL